MSNQSMADAEFAGNIPPGFAIAGGYYGGPNAAHVWTRADWARFPGYRLPIWVGGQDGPGEAAQALDALADLGVPVGAITVLDMETRIDVEYVTNFTTSLQLAGYRTWVYGSRAFVFGNPPANGYWVADYGITHAELVGLLAVDHVRAVQYENGPGFDSSEVKQWTEGEMWHG